ncbi:Mammalian cell entry related domain protein [Desulfurobacterium thermolithotrophum DSM 11699]|uniref:Mammalian cell entry related domain protein n=1 Tax=Desulfurobacterium thermolithotrophum (strain DSM 11699 / BSA) TaxID=868864 RepID=F0S3N0_DESTD|nr:MlaD family protein [Desulfurobacterium thermolithotrophum]ADY73452.1 Mammalian cell entry related domain protein [Desulfurobacterium thermolithotrophum DSM 11699]
MAKKLSLEAKVGAFVVLSFLGLGVIATTLEPLKFKRGISEKHYYIKFKNVAGLEKDAPVRVAGVTVGKVIGIKVKENSAIVEIIFLKPVKLYKDASARIETMGLMGEKYVELNPGSPLNPELPSGAVIEKTQDSPSIDELISALYETIEKFNNALITPNGENRLAVIMDKISQLTSHIDKAVNNLNGMMEENRKTIKEVLENALVLSSTLKEELPQIMDNVNSLTTQLSEIAVENRQDIRETIVSLREVSERAPKIAEKIDKLTSQIQKLLNEENLQNIQEITKNLKSTSKEFKELLTKVNEGKGTIGKLFNDETLYKNLSKTTETLGKVADKFQTTKTFIGFRGDVNTRTGDTRGILSLKILPAEDHYYLLEVVGDSQGKVDKKDYYITYDGTTERREEIVKNYKTEFTLQYAKVFNDKWLHPGSKFVLRGGLKESTGGIGLDYIYNDKYMIFSDVWDAGRKELDGKTIPPHLRIGLRYNLNKNWYLYFGGDELLYHKYRGFFVGTGVLFGDDDLKYLLGSIPGGIK